MKDISDTMYFLVDPHPRPYEPGWKENGSFAQIMQTCTMLFYFGSNFWDKVTCDVTNMDCCELLLGKAYKYDRTVYSDAYSNTHRLHKDTKKYVT